ncbi:MAG: lytic transglycosylase, partial [Bacteroidetes bacterium]|nr:lytic transglycosylase [Bacteroidota bacterium]
MMKKVRILMILFLLATQVAGAFTVSDTIIIQQDDINSQKISTDLDSLVNDWYVKKALESNPWILYDDTTGIQYPDSVYTSRIAKINSIIKLNYNNIIRNHIHVYTIKKRPQFKVMLGLKDYYFPMIEDIFDYYGLPVELKYMAVIESALNPNAVNRRSGATGLWQFIYSTGRSYGLTINSIVDERRDPVKATHAAARYIRDLYDIYKDWILVIAAYNCGPGNVNKAIRRSGNRKDYWQIYYRLPRETRGYIPQFIAAAYAINYYPEHNIQPVPIDFPLATDTIMLNKDIHLTQISEVMGLSLGELRALNPQYRTGLVPGSTKPSSLTLPLNHLGDFIDMNDTIRSYKSEVYLDRTTLIADPTRAAFVPPDIKGKTKLLYTVKEGDNLGFISEWYRVGLSDLRYWNNIYRNTIRIGQEIVIYIDPANAENYSRINSMSFAEKQASIGKTATPVSPIAQVMTSEPGAEYITPLLLFFILICFTGLSYLFPGSNLFPSPDYFIPSINEKKTAGVNEEIITRETSGDSVILKDNNSDPLGPFLDSLGSSNSQIRVMYYGDSQIEGDRITFYLRKLLRDGRKGTGPGLFLPVMPVMYTKSLWIHSSSDWKRYNYLSYGNGELSHNRLGPFMTLCRFLPEGTITNEPVKALVRIR